MSSQVNRNGTQKIQKELEQQRVSEAMKPEETGARFEREQRRGGTQSQQRLSMMPRQGQNRATVTGASLGLAGMRPPFAGLQNQTNTR